MVKVNSMISRLDFRITRGGKQAWYLRQVHEMARDALSGSTSITSTTPHFCRSDFLGKCNMPLAAPYINSQCHRRYLDASLQFACDLS